MKNFKKFILIIFVLSIVSFPLFSLAQPAEPAAQVCNNISNIGDILCKISSILKSIIPLLIAIGVIYFIWGVVQYVIKDDEEAKKKGKNKIIYGLIGFVVIFGLWGLVSIVMKTFGNLDQQGAGLVSNFVQNNASLSGTGSLECALGSNPNLGNLFNYATCFIYSSVIPLIIALAVAMFIWGVVQYVINSDEEAKKERGKQFMIWGIIGLTVMVGIWGLVSILGSTFGIENAIPQLN